MQFKRIFDSRLSSDMKKGSGSGSEMEDDKILWYPRSELNYDKNPATEKTMIRIRLQSKP